MMQTLKEKLVHLSKIRVRIEIPTKKPSFENRAAALLQKSREFCENLSRDKRLLQKMGQLQSARRILGEKSRWARAEAKKQSLIGIERLKKIRNPR